MVDIASVVKNEKVMIGILVGVFGLILAGVLIGAWQGGLDISYIFLGTHLSSSLEHTRGIIALEGLVVAVTLLFGGLFIAGIVALLRKI